MIDRRAAATTISAGQDRANIEGDERANCLLKQVQRVFALKFEAIERSGVAPGPLV